MKRAPKIEHLSMGDRMWRSFDWICSVFANATGVPRPNSNWMFEFDLWLWMFITWMLFWRCSGERAVALDAGDQMNESHNDISFAKTFSMVNSSLNAMQLNEFEGRITENSETERACLTIWYSIKCPFNLHACIESKWSATNSIQNKTKNPFYCCFFFFVTFFLAHN